MTDHLLIEGPIIRSAATCHADRNPLQCQDMTMANLINAETRFYIRSMGKLLRVTAMLESDDEANAYMRKHDGAAVVACLGSLVLVADKNDHGVPMPRDY